MLVSRDQGDPLTFKFTVASAGGKTTVEPDLVSGEIPDGLYPGGHARIKKKDAGKRTLSWHSTGQFTIVFEEMSSDAEVGTGDLNDLFQSHDNAPHEDPATGLWVYNAVLKAGPGSIKETVAYKYTVTASGASLLDPLIIVDR
jgi:hypothetical protein